MYKERKKTTHGEIGENVITTSSNIYISKKNTIFAITKWSQDRCTIIMYLKEKEKKRYKSPHYIPHKKINTPPNKNVLY